MIDDKAKLIRVRKIYSLRDFQLALSSAAFLAECEPDEKISKVELRRYKSYETAMVVAYSRPFSESRGIIPRFSLRAADIKLNESQRKLHESIIRLRNKSFAHSDEEMMRMLVTTFPVDLGKEEKFFHMQTTFDEGLDFVGASVQCVIELIRYIIFCITSNLYGEVQRDPDAFNFRWDYMNNGGGET